MGGRTLLFPGLVQAQVDKVFIWKYRKNKVAHIKNTPQNM